MLSFSDGPDISERRRDPDDRRSTRAVFSRPAAQNAVKMSAFSAQETEIFRRNCCVLWSFR
jgi:hypothetical protein